VALGPSNAKRLYIDERSTEKRRNKRVDLWESKGGEKRKVKR